MLTPRSRLLAVVALALPVLQCLESAEAAGPPNLALQIELRPQPLVPTLPTSAAGKPPAQVTFQEGQPVSVTFTITNRGTEAYRYMDRGYDRSGRMWEYALAVTDAQGLRQPDPRQPGGSGGGMCQDAQLAPGSSFSKEICLNEWVMPLAPGRYAVCGTYSPEWLAPGDRQARPHVSSAPVAFEITHRADMDAYISGLGSALPSKDEEGRKRALLFLSFTGSPGALRYLVPALLGRVSDGRLVAREGFRYMRDTRACAAAVLSGFETLAPNPSADDLLRRYEVPPERTIAAVVRGLGLPEPWQRICAAQCLPRYAALGAAPLAALCKAAQDPEPEVRAAAVGVLGRFRQREACDAALEASHDPEVCVRRAAVFALSAQGSEAAMVRLQEMVGDVPWVAHEVIAQVKSGRSPLARSTLTAALVSADKMVRIDALVALFGLGDDIVRYTIADELAHLHPSTQSQVISNWLVPTVVGQSGLVPPKYGASPDDWGQAWVNWLRQDRLPTQAR